MKNFNLNIDDYTNKELFDLLSLSSTSSTDDIEQSKSTLASQLFSQPDFNPDMRQNIILFLDTACEKIKNINNISIAEHGLNILINDVNDDKSINPLNIKYKTSYLNIDSRFRDNYFGSSASNFSFDLPVIHKKVTSLRVLTVNIPLTYYSISDSLGNNRFLIYDRIGNSNNAWLVRLPDGNYNNPNTNDHNGASLIDRLNNSITNAIRGKFINNIFTPDSSIALLTFQKISYYVDSVNGRGSFCMIPVNSQSAASQHVYTEPAYEIYFNIDTNGNINNNSNIQMNLGWLLGFRKDKYTLGDQQQVANSILEPTRTKPTYVSEGICNLNTPMYGYLAIDDFKSNYTTGIIPAFSTSSLDSNIIARFNFSTLRDDVGALNVGKDSILSGIKYTREYFGPTDISKLKLTLYDELGRIIDLNNMDWSLLIEFISLYT